MTEAEWLACYRPGEIARFARDKVAASRFKWVALEWAARIDDLIEPRDRPGLRAFTCWVEQGRPIATDGCGIDDWHPLDSPTLSMASARACADAMRRADPLGVAAHAGAAAAHFFPARQPDKLDASHSHRKRSNKAKIATSEKQTADRDAWLRAKQEHQKRIGGECCNQLRDVIGNPFRPVTVAPEWRTAAAVALAESMYRARDFAAMPILADALQDAGCYNEDILNHCREPGPHVRGCWVVHLVTGRE